jgi:hypothetical protein
MSSATPSVSPYKGLMPYTKDDAAYFFGRERERELITANLMASRLTLLYGPSGVGKSSVLNAGVIHSLQERALADVEAGRRPDSVVVAFSWWRDEPLQGLKNQITKSIKQFVPDMPAEQGPTGLSEFIRECTQLVDSELLIILDQFEECFLYHSHVIEDGSFVAELPRAINRPDLRANFLISIREDSLAKMDFFKGRIPNLFDNYLRIEHLRRNDGRAAITKPLDQYNKIHGQTPPAAIEPLLVEAVLNQVKVGEVAWSGSGLGTVDNVDDDRIETPYLQLVMTRLWEEEINSGSSTLRFETLERLGGATSIVRTHLDKILTGLSALEQDHAATVFRYLVTPSGSKIALTVGDLKGYTDLHETAISSILEKLSGNDVRILRTVNAPRGTSGATRYEIFHDVLGTTILDWRTRHVGRQELASARKKLVSLSLPFVIGFVADFILCIVPFGTLVVWAMLRSKTPAIKPELVRILTIGWFIGWVVGLLVAWGGYFALATVAPFDSPETSEAMRNAMPFLTVSSLVLPRLFAPVGSAIGFLKWRRKALAKLVSAGIQGATTTLTDYR